MDWTKKMIETGDGACLYTRHIGQGQPLLLIHGAVVDSEFFTDFAEILSEKYHVITYDRRGYGYSGADSEEEDREKTFRPYYHFETDSGEKAGEA